jgi:hypothetical protein
MSSRSKNEARGRLFHGRRICDDSARDSCGDPLQEPECNEHEIRRILWALVRPVGIAGAVLCTAKAFLPQPVVTRLLAIGMILTGIVLLLRLLGHLHDEYWGWAGVPAGKDIDGHKLLSCLVVADVLLTALWIASGVWMLIDPDEVVQCLVAIFLFVTVPSVAAWTVCVAERLAMRRGSEYVRGLEWVKDLRDIQDRMETLRPMEWLANLWMLETKPKDISWLITMLATFALMVASANAPETAAQLIRVLNADTAVVHRDGRQDERTSSGSRSEGHPERPKRRTPVQRRAPGPRKTYAQICRGDPFPGRGDLDLPGDPPRALYDLWLGPKGLGAVVAGCAQKPHGLMSHSGVWWAVGLCGTELRSLAIGTPRQRAVLLLQQAARFAWARVQDGSLLGASSRQSIGAGDFVLVDTERGTTVLIRARSSTGQTEQQSTSTCEDFADENVPYTEVPPPLVELWLGLARVEWVWPIEREQPAGAPRLFAFVTTAGEIVSAATCSPDRPQCELRGPERSPRTSTAHPHIGVEDLLEIAPAALSARHAR